MQSQKQTSPTPDLSQQIVPSPVHPQSRPKRNLIITGIVAVIVVIGGATTAYLLTTKPTNNAARTQTNTAQAPEPLVKAEQVLTNPVDNAKVTIEQTDYYSLAVGSTTYYGPILKINDSYVRMLPTAYKNEEKLMFTGNELHGPESATFFMVSNISSVRKLNAASADDASIINFVKPKVSQSSYAYPSDTIDAYLETSQLQAFVFKDGMVLFTKTASLQGTFLSGAKHVYYLASTDGQVSLTIAKPEQYIGRSSGELLYWQNLKSDGRVAKAIADYEKASR